MENNYIKTNDIFITENVLKKIIKTKSEEYDTFELTNIKLNLESGKILIVLKIKFIRILKTYKVIIEMFEEKINETIFNFTLIKPNILIKVN